MTKNSLRIILLGAALSAVSFNGLTIMAADDNTTTPAKPADPTPPATRPARTRGGNFNPADRIKNYRDQFEGLNLTDDQMKKIDGFLDTATAAVTAAGDDRRAGFTAVRKLDEDVQSILTDTQKAALRAKQTAMMFDRVKTRYTAAELKLTDDQTAKIGAIIDDAKKQAAALTPGTDAQEDRTKTFQLMRDTDEKVRALLTPDQLKLLPQRGGRGNRGAGGGNTPPATPPAKPANPPA